MNAEYSRSTSMYPVHEEQSDQPRRSPSPQERTRGRIPPGVAGRSQWAAAYGVPRLRRSTPQTANPTGQALPHSTGHTPHARVPRNCRESLSQWHRAAGFGKNRTSGGVRPALQSTAHGLLPRSCSGGNGALRVLRLRSRMDSGSRSVAGGLCSRETLSKDRSWNDGPVLSATCCDLSGFVPLYRPLRKRLCMEPAD
jgi:hypothetical protein